MADRSWFSRGAGGIGPGPVVGMRWLPPARLVSVVTRVRAAVGSLHVLMAPPPLRIVETMLGVVDHAALVGLCDLGVPDALDHPMTIRELAGSVGADEAALEVLMRYAAARRWVRLDRRGRVAPTKTSRFLAADHPGGWRAWVGFAGRSEVAAALAALPHAARTGQEAFAVANGDTFFDHLSADRGMGDLFDDAMAAGGRLHGLALARAVDWSDVERVCDVGGGNGALLSTLLAAHPRLHGVLFDLPPVVAGVSPSPRLDVIGGDAFETVPAGNDLYLLVNVLHDWDDRRAVALLRQIAADAPADARVVIVEAERRPRPVDGIAARTDVLMLALAPGGRERTEADFTTIARHAGYRVTRTIPLASADRALILQRL